MPLAVGTSLVVSTCVVVDGSVPFGSAELHRLGLSSFSARVAVEDSGSVFLPIVLIYQMNFTIIVVSLYQKIVFINF